MADNSNSSGFVLPTPAGASGNAPAATGAATEAPPLPGVPAQANSSRDLLIGGGVLLVLMVAFLFAKGAYANMLVGRRVEPRSANAAGWWLFIFLTLISVGGVLAAVRGDLLTTITVAPLGLGALVALVLMLLSSRR